MNAHPNDFSRKRLACLVWFCILMLSACRRGPTAPSFSEGNAMPTSQPKEDLPVSISARLLERLVPSSSSTFGPSQYGSAIALCGETLAVGASERYGMPGKNFGKVFVYEKEGEGWLETAILVASNLDDDLQADLNFGSALAMDAETLFVGAPGARHPDTEAKVGAVYLFQRGEAGWEETSILYPSETSHEASFGERLALHENILLISDALAVYVFARTGNGWVEQTRLTGEKNGERDQFGYALALDDEMLAIAGRTYDADVERYTTTSVYLYQDTLTGWALTNTLTPENGEFSGLIYSVALEGEMLMISTMDDAAGIGTGAVYVYEKRLETWHLQAKLVPADASASSYMAFGSSVNLVGDLLVVGAQGDSSQGLWSGSVYLYHKQGQTWVEAQKLWPDEVDYQGAFFGREVILFADTLVVSAPSEYGNAVYVYEIKIEE